MKNWKETDKQTEEYHRKIAVLAVAGICLLAGSPVMAAETEDLTLEQRVAQLFFVTPDQLSGVDGTTVAGKAIDMWMCFNWNMATEWSEKQWADVHDLCGSLEDQTGRRKHDRDSDEKTG